MVFTIVSGMIGPYIHDKDAFSLPRVPSDVEQDEQEQREKFLMEAASKMDR